MGIGKEAMRSSTEEFLITGDGAIQKGFGVRLAALLVTQESKVEHRGGVVSLGSRGILLKDLKSFGKELLCLRIVGTFPSNDP